MAKTNNSEKKVEAILMPIIEEKNFELVDVEFVKMISIRQITII